MLWTENTIRRRIHLPSTYGAIYYVFENQNYFIFIQKLSKNSRLPSPEKSFLEPSPVALFLITPFDAQ